MSTVLLQSTEFSSIEWQRDHARRSALPPPYCALFVRCSVCVGVPCRAPRSSSSCALRCLLLAGRNRVVRRSGEGRITAGTVQLHRITREETSSRIHDHTRDTPRDLIAPPDHTAPNLVRAAISSRGRATCAHASSHHLTAMGLCSVACGPRAHLSASRSTRFLRPGCNPPPLSSRFRASTASPPNTFSTLPRSSHTLPSRCLPPLPSLLEAAPLPPLTLTCLIRRPLMPPPRAPRSSCIRRSRSSPPRRSSACLARSTTGPPRAPPQQPLRLSSPPLSPS